MLVLTRKLQQQIKIGEQITVTILRVKGNAVRIGVQAPREIRVVRGELPKDAAALESAPTEITAITDAEDACAAGEATDELEECVAAQPPAPIAAGHLPLRRIHNRHGNAPLKQVIASCATLAK